MWTSIWQEYVNDWKAHSFEDFVIQILSIIFILVVGMIAIRLLGKKSISQMTLTDVLFIFVLTSTLGALITKPQRIFMAFLVVLTIVVFVFILEKLSQKVNKIERMMVSLPEVIYKDGNFNEYAMRKNNLTVDTVESALRQKGYPSLQVCKVVCIEPTGAISAELKAEYEPIRKIYFDSAVAQILYAINKSEYVEIVPPPVNSAFEEIELGAKAHMNKVDKHME